MPSRELAKVANPSRKKPEKKNAESKPTYDFTASAAGPNRARTASRGVTARVLLNNLAMKMAWIKNNAVELSWTIITLHPAMNAWPAIPVNVAALKEDMKRLRPAIHQVLLLPIRI